MTEPYVNTPSEGSFSACVHEGGASGGRRGGVRVQGSAPTGASEHGNTLREALRR